MSTLSFWYIIAFHLIPFISCATQLSWMAWQGTSPCVVHRWSRKPSQLLLARHSLHPTPTLKPTCSRSKSFRLLGTRETRPGYAPLITSQWQAGRTGGRLRFLFCGHGWTYWLTSSSPSRHSGRKTLALAPTEVIVFLRLDCLAWVKNVRLAVVHRFVGVGSGIDFDPAKPTRLLSDCSLALCSQLSLIDYSQAPS